jgi:hypothetical protein
MRGRPSGSTTEGEDDDTNSPRHATPSTDRVTEDVLRTSRQRPTAMADKAKPSEKEMRELREAITHHGVAEKISQRRRAGMLNPWTCSWLIMAALATAAALGFCIFTSFTTRQLDPKGAAMSYMASAFVRYPDFDTEHTRFASKYSLHLYREGGIDDSDTRVCLLGSPILC